MTTPQSAIPADQQLADLLSAELPEKTGQQLRAFRAKVFAESFEDGEVDHTIMRAMADLLDPFTMPTTLPEYAEAVTDIQARYEDARAAFLTAQNEVRREGYIATLLRAYVIAAMIVPAPKGPGKSITRAEEESRREPDVLEQELILVRAQITLTTAETFLKIVSHRQETLLTSTFANRGAR